MKNKKFYILHFSFFILLLISLLPCSSPTESSTGSLSGTINLEDQTDHSGIIIGVYNLVELDTTITRINAEYPHIGIEISQHTEFDHRFAEPVRYTQTDANGNFKITDIPTGRYNLVVMKHGFGFRYIYNVQINEGSNSLSNQPFGGQVFPLDSKENPRNAGVVLYPETIVSSDITDSTTFESYHHYIITDDIWVYDELTIEPGAVIRLNPGVRLTIRGDLTAIGKEDNMIWFTSNDSILNSPPKSELELFNKVELSGTSDKEVRWCKFDNAGTGLLSVVNGFSISNCIFRNSLCGFHAINVDSVFCSNLLCEDITGEEGIYFENYTDGIIEKNICVRCENGIKVKSYSNPEVKNNYISNCNTGIDISWYSSPEVHNNEIYECGKGVYTHVESYPDVYRNEIQSDYGVVAYKCYAPNIITVNYSNLNCDKYAIQLKYTYYYVTSDIDARNNYFYTTNDTEIQNLIYDKNDVEESQQEHIGEVFYKPFLTQEYPYAGMKGD